MCYVLPVNHVSAMETILNVIHSHNNKVLEERTATPNITGNLPFRGKTNSPLQAAHGGLP
jgi:hypothetical protein